MKKLRLFASLATLCLCIAVLCIGIYAVQTPQYSINGSITCEDEDVFAKINTKVFKVAGTQTIKTMQTNVNTLATTAFSDIDTNTYIEDTKNTLKEYDTTSETDDDGKRTLNIVFAKNDAGVWYYTYYVVINIENLANTKINAKLTDGTTYTNLVTANKLIQNEIASGETKNLVVAFSLEGKTFGNDTTVTIDYKVEIGYTTYSAS